MSGNDLMRNGQEVPAKNFESQLKNGKKKLSRSGFQCPLNHGGTRKETKLNFEQSRITDRTESECGCECECGVQF